jgi:hypothetical protein
MPSLPILVSSFFAFFLLKKHEVVLSGEQIAFCLPKKRLQVATAVRKPFRA